MSTPIHLLAALCLVATLFGGEAHATDLGLSVDGIACQGTSGTYGYRAVWQGTPKGAYEIYSGNQCQQNGICGVATGSCTVSCSTTGRCEARLAGCQAARGAAWVKVVAAGNRRTFATAKAPYPASRCAR